MKKKRKIYLSIPISDLDEATQRAKADNLAIALSKKGWEVVNPFDIYCGRNPTYADYISYDIRALMDCDAIYMCEGWKESCGCTIEYKVATTLNKFDKHTIEIIYEKP